MNFVSVAFFVFLPVVFLIYWIIGGKRRKYQNSLLLIASFVFYGYLDYRFCFLLIFSILVCYLGGLKIADINLKHRKCWLWLFVCLSLIPLFFFKYFNFFVNSFADFVGLLGLQANHSSLRLIIPIGVSFYTFHGLSYIIDIYNKKIEPTKNIVDYSLFISFFPLLVAGPIERATHLLPQIKQNRAFNYPMAVDGIRQMLWGFFKKTVIADGCAGYVDHIFLNYQSLQASTLVLGTILFSIQIYCDFSGYSDIAIGTARLFGINLMRNFSYPYFSRDIAEFWRRWHISLTTWFRDYIYIPLGGSRVSKAKTVRNILIVFLISGFWHGANWTFISWGLLHALFFIPLYLLNLNRKHLDIVAKGRLFPNVKEFAGMVITFAFVSFARIFFRSETISDAFNYTSGLFSSTLFSSPFYDLEIKLATIIMILVMFVAEWLQRDKQHALQLENIKYRWVRWSIYLLLVYAITWLSGEEQGFIYFQF